MEPKKLRSGYTTGTCASAAAKAAAVFLFGKIRGEAPEDCGRAPVPTEVTVRLPKGERVRFAAVPWQAGAGDRLSLAGYWGVRKDSGDDPDVTNGAWVWAAVGPVGREEFSRLCREGRGYAPEECPGIYIDGGPGIGMVTKRGLSCPVGHYAINPVPCRMIAKAVQEACEEYGYDGLLKVELAIPAGVRLAEQTFNPKLGIEGGISVLGTTGIVSPMSEAALVETIRLEIRTRVFAGQRFLLLTPGNYGEAFLLEQLQVPVGEAVKCSNFLGDAMELLAQEGVFRILFVGHIGKLIKAAGGMRNTHSRYGDRRMEILEALARACGEGQEEFLFRLRQANTTDEALALLQERGLGEQILCRAAEGVKQEMEAWSGGRVLVEVVAFSAANRICGRTSGADSYLEDWRKGERI